jgi:Iap family predicted aminopeptidase
MKRLLSPLLIVLIAAIISSAQRPTTLDVQYRDAAGKLIGAALVDNGGWEKLSYLTTRIGNRLSGSASLERAIQWVFERMKEEGLENPRLQPVRVPHWLRGRESARVIAPVEKPLNILGLGSSVGTGPNGVSAPVVVVGSFDELEALGELKVKGKIVLYDVQWKGYDQTNIYRTSGASRAARLGAVASLVRSMTGSSLYTPHTGNQNYAVGVTRIPAAAITVEEAAWIRRLIEGGQEVRVNLQMEAQMLPDADSANVIAEITGRELPDEVVVIGGHIDSWDVGQGAHDDGGGMVAAWQAVTLMKQLGLRPRRTIRVVAWTNEENGGRGGQAYLASLGSNVSKHVAAIEMDDGVERPLGFRLEMKDNGPDGPQYVAARAKLLEIVKLLDAIGSNAIVPGDGGADVDPLMRQGVPALGLNTIMEHYFDWHHTNADSLDKVDIQVFRRCIATLAVTSYVLADMPGSLLER